MKKLIFIILICFLGKFSISQTYPTPPQNLGSINILVRDTGGLAVRQTFIMPVYADTTAANTMGYPKNYKGSMIFTTTNSKVYVRDNAMLKWNELGGGTLQGLQSVLDTDNLQTRNDSIRGGGFSWVHDNLGLFKVNANNINMGATNTSNGTNSVALGSLVTSSGTASFGAGLSVTASGQATVAMGANTTASNTYSVGIGHGANNSGMASYTLGEFSNVSGNASFAFGSKDTITVDSSGTIGVGLSNAVANSLKLGYRGTSNLSILKGTNLFNNGGEDSVLTTDVNGNVKMKLAGGGGSQGLQDVITVDPVLTQDNTIDGGGFDYVDSNVAARRFYADSVNLMGNGVDLKVHSNGVNVFSNVTGTSDRIANFSLAGDFELKSTNSAEDGLVSRLTVSSGSDIAVLSIDSVDVLLKHYPDSLTSNYSTLVRDRSTGKIGVITASSGGVTTLAAIGSSPNANGATISGSTLTLQPADGSFGGVITTGTQTIAGDKTFSGSNAYGTPTSITLTNGTGLPISTGVSGLGTGIATFLATPSSANLRTALTDENGTGAALFNSATSPTFLTDITTPKVIGSTSSGGTLTLQSTSHATKGNILFGTGGYNEANNRLGVGTTTFTVVNGLSPKMVMESDGHAPFQIRAASAATVGLIQFIHGGTCKWTLQSQGTLDSPNDRFIFKNPSNSEMLTLSGNNVGIGVATPTAALHIKAGTATANTAPLKFTSGVSGQTTKEAGAVNYDGSNITLSDATYAYTLSKTLTGSASLDFGSTAASTSTDLTITVTGATDGDVVSLGVPNTSVSANSCYTAWVSASNTVTVRFNNYQTVGAIDPSSATFKVSVVK